MRRAPLLLTALLAACPTPTPPNDATTMDALSADALSADAAEGSARDASSDACVPGPAMPGDTFGNGLPLPAWSFRDARGAMVPLWSHYAPCEPRPRLLVLRTVAAWSGPSRYSVAHTHALRALPGGDRLRIVDLLVLGESNLPATQSDLARFAQRYDEAPDALLADPAYSVRDAFINTAQLPLVALVDTRSMTVLELLFVPDGNDLPWALDRALARLDGRPRPARPTPVLFDGRFPPDQWEQVRAMSPVPPPPPDPSNRFADNPAAAALGARLFVDTALSPAGISCARCHDPAQGFSDGRATGMGVAVLDRNTPSVQFSAWQRWQFWDGRADSLWAQALGPMENAREMNGSRLRVAHRLASAYASEYQTLFGPLPALADTTRFPLDGRPGEPAYDNLSAADRRAIDTVFANAGKALAAYERSLPPPQTPFDRYVAGNLDALSPEARDGLAHFFETGCIQCHFGPTLTNDSFHNIQMPTGRVDGLPDRGRLDAPPLLLANPFNASGAFSDLGAAAPWLDGVAMDPLQLGQFRTPPLRGTAQTGPWGHGGTFATLDAVILHYAQRHLEPVVAGSVGTQDPHLPSFHMDAPFLGTFVAFLRSLSP